MDGSTQFRITDAPNSVEKLYESKKQYKKLLDEFQDEIDDLQTMMYAHDRYSMLLIFQAMDAAGKDGTIRHVMSGVNPHGVIVSSLRNPAILNWTMIFCGGQPSNFLQGARLGSLIGPIMRKCW